MKTNRAFLVFAAALAIFALSSPAAASAAPSTRIINGTVVPNSTSNWPYIVALVDSTDFQFCGGTLIAPTWVVTAAHCETVDAVIIGRKKLSNTGVGERIDVISQTVHPGWDPDTYENDVQVLQLAHAPSSPQPITLAQPADDPAPGSSVAIAGWGDTISGSGLGSDDLREAQVEVIANSTCDSDYGGGAIGAGMLCASHFESGNNRDTCQGDSGGPLVASTAGGARLAGITSWGNGCALDGFPGVYTRVSSYVDWIAAAIGPHVAFDTPKFNFGSKPVGTPVTATLTVRSTGSSAVSVTAASLIGDGDFSIVSDGCSGSGPLAVGATCSIGVKYNPTQLGLVAATLKLNTDSASSPTTTMSLSGYGFLGAGSSPTIAPKLALAQTGHAKSLAGGKVKVTIKAYYIIPSGVNFTTACSNQIQLTALIPHVRKAYKTQGAAVWTGSSRCVAKINLRLPRSAKHKKVAFNLRFPGNTTLAPSERDFKLRIK